MRNKINRRNFLHALAVLSASTLGRKALAAPTPDKHSSWNGKIKGLGESGNVYEELGLTTVINGQGTMTYLGGIVDAAGGGSGDEARFDAFRQRQRPGSRGGKAHC